MYAVWRKEMFGKKGLTYITNLTSNAMEQQVNIITLGLKDMDGMANWYNQKFGWSPVRNNNGTISIRLTNMLLVLVQEKILAKEMCVWPEGKGFKQFVLTIGFNSEKDLDKAFKDLEEKGVTIIREPQRSDEGIYKAYVADPEENFWELAYYPFVEIDHCPMNEIVFQS